MNIVPFSRLNRNISLSHLIFRWKVFTVTLIGIAVAINASFGGVLLLVYKSIMAGVQVLVPYALVTLVLVFLFNSIYGLLANRDFSYLLNPLYLIYQFLYLQPLRLWALVSLDTTEWGTK